MLMRQIRVVIGTNRLSLGSSELKQQEYTLTDLF